MPIDNSILLGNSRFSKPVMHIIQILKRPLIIIHDGDYKNTINGIHLGEQTFEKVSQYLTNENYPLSDKKIILNQFIPSLYLQGEINKIEDYITFLEGHEDPFKTINEYAISLKELRIAQITFDKLLSEFFDKISPNKNDRNTSRLTIDQIALKLYYEFFKDKKSLTRELAMQIIKEYGLCSGDKLYQRHTFYAKKTNRLAVPETRKKLENKIQLFNSVIDILPNDYKKIAQEELETIKSKGKSLLP
ncbi:hypothetical protein [Algoriphagus limi]|uniref:Uncharacterized protein n=1 Tax=Algoriphagus limi TaxID=2975273 RepID=A0ABT2G4N4_9BACT|nr:hypothetical protein [Algoriphagus limi]MCS5488917.1 hypothetical protein [Algoriphagus limi]